MKANGELDEVREDSNLVKSLSGEAQTKSRQSTKEILSNTVKQILSRKGGGLCLSTDIIKGKIYKIHSDMTLQIKKKWIKLMFKSRFSQNERFK